MIFHNAAIDGNRASCHVPSPFELTEKRTQVSSNELPPMQMMTRPAPAVSSAAVPVKTITRTSRGTMLLTVGEGVAVVDPSSLEYRFIAGENLNNILAITTDTAGDIWSWSHGQLSHFDFSDDAMSPRIDSRPFAYDVRAMAVDSRGRLWFNDRRCLMTVPLPAGDAQIPPPDRGAERRRCPFDPY